MTAVTIQDQVSLLLQKRLAEDKISGASSPDIETATLLEQVAINLTISPRAVLYTALLARNSILNAIDKESAQIATLKKTIQDLGNVSYAIKNTQSLEKAKNALLEIEGQERLSVDSVSFKKFNSSVDDFLKKGIKKNVVKKGATSLTRPSEEAKLDLPTDLASLKSLHADLLDRLYALSVGVPNFLSSPLSTIIGLSTTNRVRTDIESIIESITSDPSASGSRDYVTRLLAGRAALKSLGSFPDFNAPIVDSAANIPVGWKITATSAPAQAVANGLVGPYVLPTAASLTVQDAATSLTYAFPLQEFDLKNNAHVLLTVPAVMSFSASDYLFIRVRTNLTQVSGGFTLQSQGWWKSSYLNGVASTLGDYWQKDPEGKFYRQYRVALSAVTNMSQLRSAIDTALLANGSQYTALTGEFPKPGSGRLALAVFQPYFDRISIDNVFTEFVTTTVVYSPPDPNQLVYSQTFYTSSAHETFGVTAGQFGVTGILSAVEAIEAFNGLFSSIATAGTLADGSISITGVSSSPGALLTISGNAASVLGISGTTRAVSNTVLLYGTVNGVTQPSINPNTLMDLGDLVTVPTGSSSVQAMTDTAIILASQVDTFSGDIVVMSLLQKTWQAMDAILVGILKSWLRTAFRADLAKIDSAIAMVSGSSTPAHRNAAIDVLDSLATELTSLRTGLSDPSSILPPFAAKRDQLMVESILSLFAERKFDRASDLFLRCKIQEVFSLDYQTASFGGDFLKAASDFMQTDVIFPNRALDEGLNVNAVIKRGRK